MTRSNAGARQGPRKAPADPRRLVAMVAGALLGTASGVLAQSAPVACLAPGSSLRLDHVPVAVGDLDALSRRLTDEFGFHVRDGRRDANGLETAEIGFGDGTRLELRTVSGSGDPDASGATELRRYTDLIVDGGGGAYVALAGNDGTGLDELLAIARDVEPELAAAGSGMGRRAAFPPDHPLQAVFFVEPDPEAQEPPTVSGLPEHPNGARGLQAVWIMMEDPDRLTRFLLAFGARDCGPSRHPEHLYGRAVGIRGGTVYVVDARLWMADPGSAPVVSLTVRGGRESASDNIVLGNAGGLWIELRPSEEDG
ncbi:MAG: VOC family protein [Gemmatimonadota bacterium]|uniref:VOC family protein n=1 Tax=Candidatus Palauibacter scopulicola TaxID=3056741 RepID=UPI00239CE02F|nr:VOC family protein [Candidatus Palauibacter scopulicola]MDE2661770.1 VOC family protein [Candidatus Palauibacter scopulicola]